MESGARKPIRGEGWVGFAVVMFFVLGSFNVIDGLAAATEADSFVEADLLIGSLVVWGIVTIILGVAQLYASWALFDERPAGIPLGIALAALNLIGHLFLLPAYPIWSVLIMVLDVMVIYGLTVFGHHFRAR